jgi:hypothetical protein
MAKFPLDIVETINREVRNPHLEIIEFNTQGIEGDWYDSKKFGQVQAAFACNLTSDSKEIRVSWANQSNGQPRITVIPEEADTNGYLVIFGTK